MPSLQVSQLKHCELCPLVPSSTGNSGCRELGKWGKGAEGGGEAALFSYPQTCGRLRLHFSVFGGGCVWFVCLCVCVSSGWRTQPCLLPWTGSPALQGDPVSLLAQHTRSGSWQLSLPLPSIFTWEEACAGHFQNSSTPLNFNQRVFIHLSVWIFVKYIHPWQISCPSQGYVSVRGR